MKVETSELEVGRIQLLGVRVRGDISDIQFARWLERYREIHIAAREKRQQLAVLFDLSDAPPLSAQQRRLQSEWNESMDELLHSITLGVAFITKSAIIRGVMTAIFWFNPPKAPHQVFSDPADGLEWLLERCSKAGQAISAETRELARYRLLASRPR